MTTLLKNSPLPVGDDRSEGRLAIRLFTVSNFTRIFFSLCFCFSLTACAQAQPLPKFVAKDGRYTFLVDGKPYIVLGAQVHNSSAWASTMEEVWPQLEALHVNTVEVPVYWQSVEPQPGKFDFSELDRIIEGARARKVRLVLLWFATWKNGMMNYVPEWVKTDPQRYPRVINQSGKGILVLSPHSKTNLGRRSQCVYSADDAS